MIRVTFVLVILGISCLPTFAASIGAELPLTDGTPDSWSGVPVMYGHQLPAGESVNTVTYYAAEGRFVGVEDELYNVVPLIVKQDGGSIDDGEGVFSVWEIGPSHKPVETGENSFEWGSSPIPDDGNLYHPAALQWQEAVDDADGGVIAFADGIGEGMHYFNVDTTEFVPDEDIGEVEPEYEFPTAGHSSPFGGRHYQLNFETGAGVGGVKGDFNANDDLDAFDIDLLSAEVRGPGADLKFDVNGDGAINNDDRKSWVKDADVKHTWFGDANLDGEFNSSDLVSVFQGGLFETGNDAGWALGDWDGDGKFNSSDFVIAFQDGGFELGPVPATSAVPEPNALALIGCLSLLLMRRRQ